MSSHSSAPASPPGFRGVFRDDADARAVYAESAGIGRALPLAIAVPDDADDLITLVKWAAQTRTALIPRGSGSSMPNGAIGAGVIVDLSRWSQIGAVNETARTIRVGPGAVRAQVDRAARASGLRFPVDPSSGAFCTIGGMSSTNAAGSHSMHFGSMRPWVRALDCVFADGTRAEIRRGESPPPGIATLDRLRSIAEALVGAELAAPSVHVGVVKDSSGYGVAAYARSRDLVDLLVGSEGTLVFFVGVELDLIPAAAATSSVLGAFATIEAAVVAAGLAREFGAVACELLDRTFLDVAASGGAPRVVAAETESALLAEVEGVDTDAATSAARALETIFRDAGATDVRVALSHDTETELWELRHAASPILARLDPKLRSMQFIEDCAVPPSGLPAYVRGVRKILADNDTKGVIFGHAGDAHVHVNPLIDVGRADWRSRLERILASVVALAASLGGTLTGEHGDGRLRTPLMDRVWRPEALEHFCAVKAAFDPLGIMNPGVKVPLPGERPVEEVKYDPDLPPLPDRARGALAYVERERAYARFRLELLDSIS
ncbi:MAG TPA: FAD-binding oxidoreductase [Gemmatimonadaceae bacterium]